MCGVKTENMALNVCRDEAEFWRTLARSFKARSRGHFQKMVLMLGLAQLDGAKADELAAIREHYRRFGAALLLGTLCAGLLFQALTAKQDGRRVRVSYRSAVPRNLRWEGAAAA